MQTTTKFLCCISALGLVSCSIWKLSERLWSNEEQKTRYWPPRWQSAWSMYYFCHTLRQAQFCRASRPPVRPPTAESLTAWHCVAPSDFRFRHPTRRLSSLARPSALTCISIPFSTELEALFVVFMVATPGREWKRSLGPICSSRYVVVSGCLLAR